MAGIPNFYDRYKGKFPYTIDALSIINRIALECGLGELFLNGNKEPNCFGGCDECRSVQTYQISATSKSIRINNETPMVVEIEKGYNYQSGGNPDYFVNFRVQTKLLNERYDEFINFFDRCFFELTGSNYNLVLSQHMDTYINLVYVPLQRQGLSVSSSGNVSYNPLIWLASTIGDNCSAHKFYAEGLPSSTLVELSSLEKLLIEEVKQKPSDTINELFKKLTRRLDEHYQK